MNKITFLLPILSLATHFSGEAYAVDSACATLLGASESNSNLGSYLKELFEEGVVTEAEVILFRAALIRGERINPIEVADLDIARAVASEKMNELLINSFDHETVLAATNHILGKDRSDSIEIEIINEEISGIMFLVRSANQSELEEIVKEYFSNPKYRNEYRALKLAIERMPKDKLYLFALEVFSQSHWANHPELLKLAIERTPAKDVNYYASHVFGKEHWVNHPELLELAIKHSSKDFIHHYGNYTFSQTHWSNHPKLLRLAIERQPANAPEVYAEHVFVHEAWNKYPELLRLELERIPDTQSFLKFVFSQPHWSSQPELLRLAIEKSKATYSKSEFGSVFLKGRWPRPNILRNALKIENLNARKKFLREKLGPYSWEGTEQEDLKEYLNRLYGRIDE